jgi:pyrroline-5-carboxylate reductase
MTMQGPLLLVGGGKMGSALLRGWLAAGLSPRDAMVIEPQPEAQAAITEFGSTPLADPAALAADFTPRIVLLAVKPQQMEAALPAYRRFARPGTFFLSIAAGKTIGYFERHLGAGTAVVRAMPNTPAAVGRGISVACANAAVSAPQRAMATALLAAAGEVAWVEDEALIDPVTALSGGGPAYVFLLMECLAKAGIAAGLPEELAMRLARVTVSGAGELARLSDEPASVLRQNVTSPGGTTLEALKILMAPDGLEPMFVKAIAAAAKRSRELAD